MSVLTGGVLLKVCVNGARPSAAHPRLDPDPRAIAREASDAVEAGAGAVHVHPKGADGRDSLAPEDVDRCLRAVRETCPGAPVGVTTGAWSEPDVGRRLAAIDDWREVPDFASVNWHEDGADDVAARLLARGIGVEAGIWHAEGLRGWLASQQRNRCLRVLVEVPDLAPEMVRDVARGLVDSVAAAEPSLPVLLHGEERSAWPALALAREWGLDTRIGLEDVLTLPDGHPATGNVDLVRAAVRLLAE